MSDEQRELLIETSRRLVLNGINRGTSGNASLRCHNGFFITPSGIEPNNMSVNDICLMDWDGNLLEGQRPSSEWRMHRDVYMARPDIQAVIHTHSTFATTVSCLEEDVPPFHYMIAITGNNTIPCAPYALFGTQELSDVAVSTLDKGYACLLAHHGMLVSGTSLDHALAVTTEAEALCEQYWRLRLTGKVITLNDEQMDAVHDKFKAYFKR
ncbi:MAG: class II aldolase/adducin family protein [Oxalobacter sp.]|nr:class II aldolase/adducin family protein [Oxalobacter sp.]